MKRTLAVLCLSVAVATLAARADDVFNYTYSFTGAGVSGAGNTSLTATETDGVFQVVTISGQVNGVNITGLLPEGTYHDNDNLFFNSETYLDDAGVSFLLDDGAQVNISYSNGDWFFQGDGNFVLDTGGTQSFNRSFRPFGEPPPDTVIALDDFTFAPVAETPEPSGFILLGTGVLGVAGVARRRFARA